MSDSLWTLRKLGNRRLGAAVGRSKTRAAPPPDPPKHTCNASTAFLLLRIPSNIPVCFQQHFQIAIYIFLNFYLFV